jgi:hypothetical protein
MSSATKTLEFSNRERFHLLRCEPCDVIVQDVSFVDEPRYWQVKRAVSVDTVVGRKALPVYSVHLVYLTPAYKARSAVWTFDSPDDAHALELFLQDIVKST